MRTLLVAVILAFSTGVAVVNADNDRVVTKNALPAKAQAFIAEYFAGKDIVAAKEEREFRVNSFEVLLCRHRSCEDSILCECALPRSKDCENRFRQIRLRG